GLRGGAFYPGVRRPVPHGGHRARVPSAGVKRGVTSMMLDTVAVLMTDVVESTDTAARVGPSAAEDMRLEHFRLLRGAVERTGGREVKSLGDGLMVVFQSASSALMCAVEMQQAVEAQNRRARERCDVRIGVSFGETTLERGDYYGEA